VIAATGRRCRSRGLAGQRRTDRYFSRTNAPAPLPRCCKNPGQPVRQDSSELFGDTTSALASAVSSPMSSSCWNCGRAAGVTPTRPCGRLRLLLRPDALGRRYDEGRSTAYRRWFEELARVRHRAWAGHAQNRRSDNTTPLWPSTLLKALAEPTTNQVIPRKRASVSPVS